MHGHKSHTHRQYNEQFMVRAPDRYFHLVLYFDVCPFSFCRYVFSLPFVYLCCSCNGICGCTGCSQCDRPSKRRRVHQLKQQLVVHLKSWRQNLLPHLPLLSSPLGDSGSVMMTCTWWENMLHTVITNYILSSACSWVWQNVPKVGFICYWGGWVGHAVETFIEFDHFSQVCWPHNCAMAEMRDARYLWAALYIVSDFSNEKLSNDIWDIFSGPCREFADLSGIWICFPPK